MPYGTLKADTLTYYTATGDVNLAISGIAISGSPLISGVSGVFTTSVSGATVTGNAGQFTTITGGTAQFTNITGVSGTFTSRISGATVTGTSGQFTTITAATGVFTTSISGATISGDVGLFNTISGNQGVFNSGLSVPSGTASSPSISFNGDPNTGLYSTGADALALSTNGTGRLFVDANGNIGAGTSTPGNYSGRSTLSLAGTTNTGLLEFRNSAGLQSLFYANANGNVTLTAENTNSAATVIDLTSRGSSGTITFKTNDQERLRITSAGFVGVGTSSVSAPIHLVTSNSKALQIECASTNTSTALNAETGIFLRNTDTTVGNMVSISSRDGNNNANAQINFVNTDQAGSGAIAFTTRSGGSYAERVRIDPTGRVGIGTSAPESSLHVSGAAKVSSGADSGGYQVRYSGANSSSRSWRLTNDVSAYGDFDIQQSTTQTGSTFASRLYINPSGSVGIGVTSPNKALAVVGTIGAQVGASNLTGASLSGTSTTTGTLQFHASDGSTLGRVQGVADGDAGYLTFDTRNAAGGNTERARIDSSGRLLVGTSTHSGLNASGYTGLNAYFANTGDTGISLSRFQNTTNSPSLQFLKSRGTSVGSLTVVSSGDDLGEIVFSGADGDEFRAGASITAQVDNTPGNNDMPGRLVFSTTADGASSPTERVRISQNGVVTVKNGAVAEIGTLTDGATVTPDFAANCNFTLTISGNRTLANPTNITAGQTGSIFIIQGTGSNALSWGSYWDFAGGTAPTLSTASGAVDRVDYVVRTSTSIHTVFTANYS